jgi:hypothetical protein
MKKMILAVAAMLAMNANAATWSEIFANNNLIVAAPFATQLGPKGIFNACSTGTALKTVKPVAVCTEVKYVEGNDIEPGHTECAKTEMLTLTMPLSGVQTKCTDVVTNEGTVSCAAYAQVPYTISLTQSVDVLLTGTAYPAVAFTKSYTIPACAQ